MNSIPENVPPTKDDLHSHYIANGISNAAWMTLGPFQLCDDPNDSDQPISLSDEFVKKTATTVANMVDMHPEILQQLKKIVDAALLEAEEWTKKYVHDCTGCGGCPHSGA